MLRDLKHWTYFLGAIIGVPVVVGLVWGYLS